MHLDASFGFSSMELKEMSPPWIRRLYIFSDVRQRLLSPPGLLVSQKYALCFKCEIG